MKLLYLNIFEGCKEQKRLHKIINFINVQKPDVFCLSEANGWEEDNFNKLKIFQKSTGFKYVHFCKSTSDFNIVLFSRFPLIETKNISEGFAHSMTLVKINCDGVHLSIILTHLSPVSEDQRLQEVEMILSNISKEKNTVLIGDLNSLSPLDVYDDKDLLKQLSERKIKKFGSHELCKDVQQKLLNFGLIDAVYEMSEGFQYSVPTTYNTDPAHLTKLRLDYAFITPPLFHFLKTAKIIRTEETNQLSDHFPIVVEFEL